MSEITNPFFLVTLQTLLAIFIIDPYSAFKPTYLFYIITPYILYFVYYILINRVYKQDGSSMSPKFNPLQEIFCMSMMILITLVNTWLITQIIPFYGGINQALGNIGSASIVTYLQQDSPEYIRRPVLVNFFLPVVIIPVLLSKMKIKVPVIVTTLLISLIFSSLYGARTLFIEAFLICIIMVLVNIKVKTSSVIATILSGIILVFGMSFLQASRSNETSLAKGAEVLSNYYAISLNQGAEIINEGIQREPMYWTFSPLFNIPIITSILGFRAVYEGIFGDIPIQSREDDFNYVKDLGADPNYNTLGIYAYTHLDAGAFGIFIMLFIFLISDYAYRKFRDGNTLGYLIFPGMFMLLLDQLRTASIFSARMPYFVIAALIIYTLGLMTNIKSERTTPNAGADQDLFPSRMRS